MIGKHIEPQWSANLLLQVTPKRVWRVAHFPPPVGRASKVRARNLLKTLFDSAMLEEYIPFDRNPMELVKVKQGSKRLKRSTVITPEQFKTPVGALSEHPTT